MPKRTFILSLAAAVMVTLAALPAGPAAAQDLTANPDLGERVWRELSYCGDCHGWAGNGVPDNPQSAGANLRESTITAEIAYETIRCGRPGTGMPSFFRAAWSERVPCYGLTAPMERGLQPDAAETALSDRYIQAAVAFIFQDFVGAGPVTREYCLSVFEADSTRCAAYPPAAEGAAPAPGPGP